MQKLTALILFLFALPALAQFSHESELGYIQTGGNSVVQTTNAKTTNKYIWDRHSSSFGGHYTYGETSQNVTVRNWDVNGRVEQQSTTHLSFVLGEIIEGNRFTQIKSRYNSDAGLKYYYIKSDAKNFFSELTYRYTIEDRYRPLENTYDNKARFYNEFDHKYSGNIQYKFWLEYVPNFTTGKDYLINGEASLTSILNSTFSLKVAYKGMYDNLPAAPGLKNYDYMTTTSLVAKF